MADDVEERERALQQSLARMHEALVSADASLPARETEPVAARGAGRVQGPLALIAGALLVAAIASGSRALWVLALAFAAAAGVAFAVTSGSGKAAPSGAPHIGMGATVADDAVVEPGAVVEMGATVRSGAVVRSGALVRMGATVGTNATVEAGAVVSWGADVHKGAVVGARAIVGAGAEVHAGAHLPPDTHLSPGAEFSSGRGKARRGALERAPAAAVAAQDPREARLDSICDKLAAELRASPEAVRGFLAAPEATVAALRSTCADLLRREQALRHEVEPAALARLGEERAVLVARIAAAVDPHIRGSLEGAVAAIDERKRHLDHLRSGADRLEAEHTRLLYTLEGLGSLFARLRTAGAEARQAPRAELERAVARLKGELDAVSDALEQVAHEPAAAATPGGPATPAELAALRAVAAPPDAARPAQPDEAPSAGRTRD